MTNFILATIAFFAAIFIATKVFAQSNNQPFTVVRHYDGDTTTVSDRNGNQFKVRHLVVDANELGQAGGKEARDYLYRLLPVGSKVAIAFTGNKSYDRAEGTIYRNGKNISLEMLKAGYVVIDDRYTRRLDSDTITQYRKAQDNAKRQKLGRWANRSTQQMPSEWRKKR